MFGLLEILQVGTQIKVVLCVTSHNRDNYSADQHDAGFAFIEFEEPRDAEDAVRDMDGRRVCGVTIKCEMAKNTSRCIHQHTMECFISSIGCTGLVEVDVDTGMVVEEHPQL